MNGTGRHGADKCHVVGSYSGCQRIQRRIITLGFLLELVSKSVQRDSVTEGPRCPYKPCCSFSTLTPSVWPNGPSYGFRDRGNDCPHHHAATKKHCLVGVCHCCLADKIVMSIGSVLLLGSCDVTNPNHERACYVRVVDSTYIRIRKEM